MLSVDHELTESRGLNFTGETCTLKVKSLKRVKQMQSASFANQIKYTGHLPSMDGYCIIRMAKGTCVNNIKKQRETYNVL